MGGQNAGEDKGGVEDGADAAGGFAKRKEYTYRQTDWVAEVCAHQFRHEYVCMLAEAEVPEEIAMQLVGHANQKMIHDVYMHLKPSMIKGAAERLNKMLK